MKKTYIFVICLLGSITLGFVANYLLKSERLAHWTQVNMDGGFRKRDDPKVFPFGNKIIMSQGYDKGNAHLTDLLVSTEPGVFNIVNSRVPYGIYSPIAAHNDWVYIVDSVLRKTQDFINYTTITTAGIAPGLKSTRYLKSLNGKLYLVGADTIWSIDPEAKTPTWTSAKLPWYGKAPRACSSVEVFMGRLVILAGVYQTTNPKQREARYDYTSLNDVWSSANPEDPDSWIEHTSNAPFAPRMWPAIVVKDSWLYISGGYNNILGENNNFNDTWRTNDLVHWKLVQVSNAYPARHASTMYIQNGDIYLAAGNTNRGPATQKDVWKLTF